MSDEPKIPLSQYMEAQVMITHLLAPTIMNLPLKDMREMIDKAEAITPVTHPELYREAGDNVGKIKKVIESLIPVQELLIDLGFSSVVPNGD